MIIDYSSTVVLPLTTTYFGHSIISVPAKVRYTDKRHPEVHYCIVTLLTRKFDSGTGLIYEHPYHSVKAWIGTNSTVHLMAPLPGEDEYDIDLSYLFAVTPEEEDIDEENRKKILGELFYKDIQ